MAVLKFLLLIKKEYKAALLGLLASLGSTFASIALMSTAGWFLTAMATAAVLGLTINLFVPSALIRLLAILRTGLRYADRLFSHAAAFKIIEKFRAGLFDRALSLNYQAQLNFQRADLERRLHGDIEKLELLYLREFMPIVCAFITGFIAGCILAAFDLRLLFAFLIAFCGAGVVVPLISASFFGRFSARVSDDLLSLNNEASVFISGLLDFMVLNALPARLERLEQLNARICKSRFMLTLIDGINQAVLMFAALLCFLSLLVIGSSLFLAGEISAAQCMMLCIGAMSAFECLQPMALALISFPEAELSAGRVFELLNGSPRTEGAHRLERPISRIDCRGICFAYTRRRQLFTNFNAVFEAGRNYALTGPLGSGKSSLIFMLLGLIKPQQGEILYDGITGESLKAQSLNEQFAVCFQEPSLMSGTILEIFTAVNPQITLAQIHELLRLVELEDFVSSLEHGLDTFIGMHGRALSGGQARRFALARALSRKAPFLLLDEPGEGLDAEQERRILKRILTSRHGIIMISHRGTGLEWCDKVLRLGSGTTGGAQS